MKAISITELKANLSNVIAQVSKGKRFVIMSNGKQVAQIIPPVDRRKDAILRLKALRKTAIIGDIVSPIDDEWEAN
jgi:prevent-host-death family protein